MRGAPLVLLRAVPRLEPALRVEAGVIWSLVPSSLVVTHALHLKLEIEAVTCSPRQLWEKKTTTTERPLRSRTRAATHLSLRRLHSGALLSMDHRFTNKYKNKYNNNNNNYNNLLLSIIIMIIMIIIMSSTAALAAYALASLAKPNPTPADVEAIAKAVKINIPKETLNFVFESIAQRDVNTLIAEGASKMSAMAASAAAPAGGAAPAAAAGAAAAPAAGKAAAKVEEESDDDIGFGLFD
eukprot:gene1297-747_t